MNLRSWSHRLTLLGIRSVLLLILINAHLWHCNYLTTTVKSVFIITDAILITATKAFWKRKLRIFLCFWQSVWKSWPVILTKFGAIYEKLTPIINDFKNRSNHAVIFLFTTRWVTEWIRDNFLVIASKGSIWLIHKIINLTCFLIILFSTNQRQIIFQCFQVQGIFHKSRWAHLNRFI